MDSALDPSAYAALGLFSETAPRYTSYPTAPQFGPGVTQEQMDGWLAALAPGSTLSVYVHVPFCSRLCWFCACRTQGTTSLVPVAGYLDALIQEVARTAERLPAGVSVTRMHWGGGSPTILSPALIARLAEALARALPMAPAPEFSVEIDPAAVDGPRLDALAAAGMTRASLGVQDFAAEVQAAIGRVQGFRLTADTVAALRARGIGSINIDLVYGLPRQTETGLAATLAQVIDLAPDRVALYGYAHVPWMAKRQKMIREADLPGAEARFRMAMLAAARFEAAGYVPIGIDHFARPGDALAEAGAGLRRNFQGYTEDAAQALIGFGASAISSLPQGHAQNAAQTTDYRRRVEAGGGAVTRGFAFGLEDRLRGRAIEMLMCHFCLDTDRLAAEFGDFAGLIAPDIVRARARFGRFVTGPGLRILPEGRPLTRLIAREFDAYAGSGARHSRAI